MDDENTKYLTGYVGVIDVLGFGRFSMDENHFYRIYKMVKHILYQKRNFERNLEYLKFAIISDTVVVMIEASEKTQDYVFFQSILSNIGLIRTFVLSSTGLYSRAAITFGKYYFNNSSNAVFGPAITRAAYLAEHADKCIDFSIDARFTSRPAAILIDEVYCRKDKNIYYDYLFHGCTVDYILNDIRTTRVGDTNYFLYNPYYEAFQDFMYTTNNEVNYSSDVLFDIFCKRERSRLENCIKESNEEQKAKFIVESEMLSTFERNFKKTGPLY